MPCCHIPQPGIPVFPPSLILDAESFARYVGGAPLLQQPATRLTSALHLEMKLWQVNGALSLNLYTFNAHFKNSWVAMMAGWRNLAAGDRFNAAEKQAIENNLGSSLPNPSKPANCILTTFDGWHLDLMSALRAMGQDPARVPNLPGGGPPTTALASFGRCQKLINIFLKYEICWQVAGQWNGRALVLPYATPQIPNLSQYLCALHAPIDAILVEELLALPIGKHLKKAGLLRPREDSPLIRQSSDADFRPWSKLDCRRTYYGFQLILRRIAMETWPKGCACSTSPEQAIQDCRAWFNQTFPLNCPMEGPDWIQAACDLPKKVIQETLETMGYSLSDGGDDSAPSPASPSCKPPPSPPPAGKEAASSQPASEKPEIYLNELDIHGKQHRRALRIVTKCDSKRNLAAICKCGRNTLDVQQGLLDLSAAFDADFSGIATPSPGGRTCCWGGKIFVLHRRFESVEAAIRYLKRFFTVRGCGANTIWTDARIAALQPAKQRPPGMPKPGFKPRPKGGLYLPLTQG